MQAALTARVAGLPLELLTLTLSHLLDETDRTQAPGDGRYVGTHSPALRVAMTLASVSRLWREAAVQAVQLRLGGGVSFLNSSLQPEQLSPLLARFLHACPHMHLERPLLSAPEAARFLDAAAPQMLYASGPFSASAAVSEVLARCEGVHKLYCRRGLAPTRFPSDLQDLTLRLDDRAVSEHLALFLLGVSALPCHLDLRVDLPSIGFVARPDPFPNLSHTRSLTLSCTVEGADPLWGQSRPPPRFAVL